jgi:hypothetical protein
MKAYRRKMRNWYRKMGEVEEDAQLGGAGSKVEVIALYPCYAV